MAIDHHTKEIPQADADAALEALGIPRDLFKYVAEVRITPKKVIITAYEESDKLDGGYRLAQTHLGRSAAVAIIELPIVDNHG